MFKFFFNTSDGNFQKYNMYYNCFWCLETHADPLFYFALDKNFLL